MTLTEKFDELFDSAESNPEIMEQLVQTVMDAPDSSERDGLLALMYHDGIGVARDLDKCFEYAEKAAFAEKPDGLGCYLLGFLCENAETPDQAEGGPRQKYDHYDAERFYEKCAGIESDWKEDAILWLGDFYMDSARGGDAEIGVEYLEKIADESAEAAGRLSDYYWNLVMPDYTDDEEWVSKLYKWTRMAARLDPEEYNFRMGVLYAEGIGCVKDFKIAETYFRYAYKSGDWRGADAMAKLLGERLAASPDIDKEEKRSCLAEIEKWKEEADRLYQEELSDPSADPENVEEED